MLHCGENIFTVKLPPIRSDQGRLAVMSAHKLYRRFKLVRVGYVGMTENYARRGFNLVVKKFAEVFHVHFALGRVDHGGISVNFTVVKPRAFDRAYYVRKLAHAGRLYQNSVGAVFRVNFFKRFCEVAYKRTAYTARIKLVHLYARVLHKAAVDAYFAEFVFYKHKLFAGISFLYKLFNKRGFARAQKSRKNIYLCHNTLLKIFYKLKYRISNF